MDPVYQLQQQIQRLRQEISNISQLTSQLQQCEQNNAAQLQQMHQHEINNSQQLQRIQQACSQINNDLNMVSGATHQAGQGMSQSAGQFDATYAGGYGQQLAGQTGMWPTQQHYQSNHTSFNPFQQQRFSSGYGWGSQQSPAIGGFAQTYATPGFSGWSYSTPNQFSSNQNSSHNFAQNQLFSQQAQQAMANRMSQSMPSQASQFGMSSYSSMY